MSAGAHRSQEPSSAPGGPSGDGVSGHGMSGSRPWEGAGKPVLRYDRPAADWEREALPLGNGALGAMVFGTVPTERL
ncbi:hypothetical protein ADZ36_32280, partial [Streptomyces fradiae]